MFKRNELIRHLEEEFPDVFHNQFAYEWLHKCMDYAEKDAENGYNRYDAVYNLCNLLPDEVQFSELKDFFEVED